MTLKQRIEALVEGRTFPLSRQDLLDAADERHADADTVTALQALHDDEFESIDELRERLDDALGMPDAVTDRSALESRTDP